MNIMSVNCRGCGQPEAVQELRRLVEERRPEVVFLMETRMGEEHDVGLQRNLGFQNTIVVKSEGEASPHKRRLKCDTNISPRRLMTHLLHQMVHHRTTLRGNGQRSDTIARITTKTRTTILIIKRGSSESCAMRDLLRVTLIHKQGWV